MKALLLAASVALTLVAPAYAKNYAVPADNPSATITLPDDWTLSEIEYGYSAVSPDKDIFFSVEYADGKSLDAMTNLNEQWIKENNIKINDKPEESEDDFNGMKGSLLLYKATDENGPTKLTFGFVPAGNNRVIMLTLWGSSEERKAHSDEIAKILSSLKPIQ